MESITVRKAQLALQNRKAIVEVKILNEKSVVEIAKLNN
jgi:hypothetical protein